jgi:glycosyltransferase involved in cell wall biosynthesis
VPGRPLIGVDAVAVGTRVTGAARVLLNVLAQLPAADPELEYVAFATPAGEATVREHAPSVQLRVVTPSRGLSWELRGAGRTGTEAAVDLLFTVRELVPLGGPPAVVHVFEPPAYRLGAFGPPGLAEARRFAKDVVLTLAFRRSLRRARAVTAGSQTTAEWLRSHAGVDADVVLPGVEHAFLESEPTVPADPSYVFHLATGDPRDNTDLVLRAFATTKCAGLRLVLAGVPDRHRNRLERRGAELGVELELAGWVSDERLRELYRGALAFAHPTKYEAYAGLPVLEAMALGTPVVVLDAPGATEAVQDVGIVIPRQEPDLLAEAFARLRDDPSLRAELVTRGRALAQRLTWDATAAAFATAFRKALGAPPRPLGT